MRKKERFITIILCAPKGGKFHSGLRAQDKSLIAPNAAG